MSSSETGKKPYVSPAEPVVIAGMSAANNYDSYDFFSETDGTTGYVSSPPG